MTEPAILSVPVEAATREQTRLDAIKALDVLNAPRDEAQSRIVSLTKAIFNVPIAHVALMDGHRQVYLASEGLDAEEAPRELTLCRSVVTRGRPLVLTDASTDPRASDNPFVSGVPHIRFYAGVPLTTRDGQTIGTLCAIDQKPRSFNAEQLDILTDLGRLAMSNLELRQLVLVDGLTGAMSRRAFRDAATRSLALAARGGQSVAVIALDIDHFKAINDGFGHAGGDTVLVEVAKLCTAGIRKSDFLGRLGGEEFAILLSGTTLAQAHAVAEKLRLTLEKRRFSLAGQAIKVTASFGIAALDSTHRDLDALLERADAALYAAKSAGRNRSVMDSDLGAEATARRRVLKAGVLHFNNRTSARDCTVRSLGDSGARVDLSSTLGLPLKLNLLIRADGFDRPCHIVTQSERHLELAFD